MREHAFVRLSAALAVLAVTAAGCADQADEDGTAASPTPAAGVSVEIGDVPSTIQGNVLELPVEATGIELVAADGDTSGETGHFHVFIDGDPPAEGEVIAREEGIIHAAASPVVVDGLSEGEHTITVVLGDGTHRRIHGDVSDEVTVTVEGPTVDADVAGTVSADESVTLEVEVTGVELVPADGDTSGETGHLHVLIDPEADPAAGDVIPPAEEGRIIHTTETTIDVGMLAQGEHTLWVVVGDGTHAAFDPFVADKLTVTVQ